MSMHIGSAPREGILTRDQLKEKVPGPGAYQTDLRKEIGKTGPKFCILGKPERKDNSPSPGPAAYRVDFRHVKTSEPSARLGSAERLTKIAEECKVKSAIPGPGAYS